MQLIKGRPWSAADDDILRTNWLTTTVPRLARDMGRSEQGVVARADRLGLPRRLE